MVKKGATSADSKPGSAEHEHGSDEIDERIEPLYKAMLSSAKRAGADLLAEVRSVSERGRALDGTSYYSLARLNDRKAARHFISCQLTLSLSYLIDVYLFLS